ITSGINNFLITYISDTQMDLSWTFVAGVTNIMIRSKDGGYPNDIPNSTTAPSDGNLVYYGNDLSFSDTSMDFDEGTLIRYYKAWAQKADGTWYVNTSTSSKESRAMALIALLGFALVISGFAVMKREVVIGIVATGAWLVVFLYTRTNPIGGMVVGDTADNALVILYWGLMALVPIISWKLGKNDKDRQSRDDSYKERSITGDRKTYSISENSSPYRGKKESSDDYFDRLKYLSNPRRRK
ncbi:MAG: hypothetical protein IMZ64_06360, partial [Bacteroidetes bacterium]|nr:hypothetical protein [Bacteroidota bacterium]